MEMRVELLLPIVAHLSLSHSLAGWLAVYAFLPFVAVFVVAASVI